MAILAVLKAGGAYLSLDPKYPKSRRDLIIREVSARVVLTGIQYRDNFESLGLTVLGIDQSMIDSLDSRSSIERCPGKSTDAAFVVFSELINIEHQDRPDISFSGLRGITAAARPRPRGAPSARWKEFGY